MAKPDTKTVRVRFAPSPTGPLHIGGVRTALFNRLFARQNNGVFILRIEDTDKERSKEEYEAEIFGGLKWLGFAWDEGPESISGKGDYGPYRQSERVNIYRKYLEKVLSDGRAYYCYCTKEELEADRQAMASQGLPPKYSGRCAKFKSSAGELVAGKMPQVIRFRTPATRVDFKDIIRGNVSFDAALFGDLAIAKNLEMPLFNFAGAIDDHEMKISHVIRGEDHLSNTPKQILFQKALGFETPEYAHLPLILNPDRSKMSKRFADTALLEYRERGYLPETIVNFLALLGWHPKGDKEIFSLDELVKEFDLRRVQKAGAIFNHDKLDWLNKEHLKNWGDERIVEALMPILDRMKLTATKKTLERIVKTQRERIITFEKFAESIIFYFELPNYEPNLLVWQKSSTAEAKKNLIDALAAMENSAFSREAIAAALKPLTDKEGRGSVLWPLRVALSGLATSPDPTEIMEVLGKEESIRRINIAIKKL